MFSTNGDSERPLPVALYARVSTEDQAERETIQNQIQVANALCPAMNLKIVDFYLDDGVSGIIPLEQRPEDARLLEEATESKFEQVVVYRLDRIGRKALVILSAWEALKQRDVALRSLTEPFDTAQPFGEFVMGILAMVAGYERDSIISRTTEGRRRKAREGLWTGGRASLGYKVVDGRLEVDAEEAELVRRIFHLYTEERLSGWKIAELLNAERVPTQATRRGFADRNPRIKERNHWDHTRIISLIKNETYAGVRHVGKQGKGSIISHEVPSIIPRDRWQYAQQLRESNRLNAPRRAKRMYLLRGLLFCGKCGRRYIGVSANSGKNPYYQCGKQGCPNRRVPAELAEYTIWQDIIGFVRNPGPILEQLQHQIAETTQDDHESELTVVNEALTNLGEERQRILYRIRKALVSDEEGDVQLVATGHERDALLARKASLEARVKEQDGDRAQLAAAESLLVKLQESAEAADETTKRHVAETLVKEIVVNHAGDGELNLHATFRFEDPYRLADNALSAEAPEAAPGPGAPSPAAPIALRLRDLRWWEGWSHAPAGSRFRSGRTAPPRRGGCV